MVISVSDDGIYYLSNTKFVIMFDKYEEGRATITLYRNSEFIGLIDKDVLKKAWDNAKR